MTLAALQLSGLEIFYLICAAVGGGLLSIRLLLVFIGVGGGGDGYDVHHPDADGSMKILSLHGLTSFLLMFGLVGFALYRQTGGGALISLLGALAAGGITFLVIGRLFAWIVRFQSSGTLSTEDTVGCLGQVYLTIPREGTGKVTIQFQNRLREYEAITEEGETLRTGERIKVLRVRGNTLVVGRDSPSTATDRKETP